jgi:poly-D-alanine transfer protein DltD
VPACKGGGVAGEVVDRMRRKKVFSPISPDWFSRECDDSNFSKNKTNKKKTHQEKKCRNVGWFRLK